MKLFSWQYLHKIFRSRLNRFDADRNFRTVNFYPMMLFPPKE